WRVEMHAFDIRRDADDRDPHGPLRPPINLSDLARIQPARMETFTDRILVRETSPSERLGDDGDARSFIGITLGKGAALQQADAHGAKVIRRDALKTGARVILFHAGLPVFNRDLDACFVAD